MLSTSNKYIRIDSDSFQSSLSSILELFEDYEDKERYRIVETHKPLETKPLEREYKNSYELTPIRKRDLSIKEKNMIQDYLDANFVTPCYDEFCFEEVAKLSLNTYQ